MEIPGEVIGAIAMLTVFLSFILVLKYAIKDSFARTRLVMTGFFWFIVATLTLAFWDYRFISLPYAVPAWFAGMFVGYVVAVREAERRLMAHGLNRYLEHFTHVHIADLKSLRWWSIINFYTVMGALLLINLIGFSTVILRGNEQWILVTCAVGAFLLGTIFAYLGHLWGLKK